MRRKEVKERIVAKARKEGENTSPDEWKRGGKKEETKLVRGGEQRKGKGNFNPHSKASPSYPIPSPLIHR